MWDLILPCVSVRDSIFHTTYAGLLVTDIYHTGTTDSRPKGGTHGLLQRIKGYQGGTHRLLQRIKGYQEGYHWLLLCQEAHIDSYKGSKDIKRHTLTLTKTQISERHTSTSVYGNIKGTHWPKLLEIDIKVVHSMQLHHKDRDIREAWRKDRDIEEEHTRSYRNTEISRRYWYTSSPRKKHREIKEDSATKTCSPYYYLTDS